MVLGQSMVSRAPYRERPFDAMSTLSIAVIGGDGIGPDVTREAIAVLNAALKRTKEREATLVQYPWGTAHYLATGRMMPENALDVLARHQAILLGAVGHPDLPDHVTLNGLLLPIRRRFDQYVNLRPARLREGVQSPIRNKSAGQIDLLVFRENTEGEYADVGGRLYLAQPEEVAVQTSVFTRRGCQRIMKAAFDAARSRRRHVTSITKSNAQAYSMVLWDDVFKETAKSYPEIQTRSLLVDAAAMEMVRRPESFDVVVASNLFGDILTDLAAAVVGGIGLAASANLNPDRTWPSMFEPVHGSAPDLAGRNIANPLAAILAASMLLEHVGAPKAAALIERAVDDVLIHPDLLTPDLGGPSTTTALGASVVERIS